MYQQLFTLSLSLFESVNTLQIISRTTKVKLVVAGEGAGGCAVWESMLKSTRDANSARDVLRFQGGLEIRETQNVEVPLVFQEKVIVPPRSRSETPISGRRRHRRPHWGFSLNCKQSFQPLAFCPLVCSAFKTLITNGSERNTQCFIHCA